ncbi:hypothetical protein BG015_001262 [Linnemannia schmuckeri]|uniref:Uncharacterized protein n=1 Tax=Linnemannia schmuckeri TaxID=64567 RepID=A0A9P5V737_9FUNG|nr:hypothetical protein BG015_001262 [Linnemannia schmuckeri]
MTKSAMMQVTKRRHLDTCSVSPPSSSSSPSSTPSTTSALSTMTTTMTTTPAIIQPRTTQRSTFFKWDRRPARRRNEDEDEGFSEKTGLESDAEGYFSDTIYTNDSDENEDEDDVDSDYRIQDNSAAMALEVFEDDTKSLSLWEKGYIDPLTSPAAESVDLGFQKVQLSRKLTDYNDFNKAWHELHEWAVFERDLEFEKDESIWDFMERMREEVDSGADYDMTCWAEYPNSEDELHHAGKKCGKTLTAQNVKDCQENHEDGNATDVTCNKTTMQHQETV